MVVHMGLDMESLTDQYWGIHWDQKLQLSQDPLI